MKNNSKLQYKVRLNKTDKFLEAVIFVLLISVWFLALYRFDTLPVNDSGDIQLSKNKSEVWLLPACITTLYFFLSIISHYPHLFNYNELITEENCKKHYTMAIKAILYLKLVLVILLSVVFILTT